ncbi:hypothetical protein MJG53_008004 [Ovis ammon polii x Ovis aries]|uniref:Uncharacterized protein n=1 Tax=Ovis ammon polii x Ovis aries TaxID=2918886 RepID=A0ACB9UZ88_9CETA|nr:hypothetical protein MJG53_008004 [Ovis ammon polii x Ovis aries]
MIWFQVSQFPNQLTPAASLKHQPTNTLRAVNLPSFDCTLAYTCHLAFFLSGGPEHSTCKADVKWTGKAPVCKSKSLVRSGSGSLQSRVPQGYYLFLRRHFSPFPLVTGLLGAQFSNQTNEMRHKRFSLICGITFGSSATRVAFPEKLRLLGWQCVELMFEKQKLKGGSSTD